MEGVFAVLEDGGIVSSLFWLDPPTVKCERRIPCNVNSIFLDLQEQCEDMWNKQGDETIGVWVPSDALFSVKRQQKLLTALETTSAHSSIAVL
jgi:hypothetical protein